MIHSTWINEDGEQVIVKRRVMRPVPLTLEERLEIRRLHATGISYAKLAKRYQVSSPTIGNIVKNNIRFQGAK